MKNQDIQVRECKLCSRLVFTWSTGHKHIVKKHNWLRDGHQLYSDQFNYYYYK